jgi:hypothetical protein
VLLREDLRSFWIKIFKCGATSDGLPTSNAEFISATSGFTTLWFTSIYIRRNLRLRKAKIFQFVEKTAKVWLLYGNLLLLLW